MEQGIWRCSTNSDTLMSGERALEITGPCRSALMATQGERGSCQRTPAKVPWPPELVDSLAIALEELLTLRAKTDLELRVRSGTGTEGKTSTDCCAPATEPAIGRKSASAPGGKAQSSDGVSGTFNRSNRSSPQSDADAKDANKVDDTTSEKCHDQQTTCSSHSCTAAWSRTHYHFKKDSGDTLGELLEEWTSHRRLRELAVHVVERSASVCSAAMEKGKTDGLPLPGPAETAQLRRDATTEALLRAIQSAISQEVRRRCMSDSHEGGLLANPSGYRGGHLDHLQPETVRGLMVDGFGVQNSLVGNEMRLKILSELELLEFDGAFSEVLSQKSGVVRSDTMCWKTLEDLDRETQPGLCHLFKCMSALPFELNKKANLCLQASWTFQLACYSEKDSFYKKHMDGGFDAYSDNGRKVTCIYYPNSPQWDPAAAGGSLRMYRGTTYKQYLKSKETRSFKSGAAADASDEGGDSVDVAEEMLSEVSPKGDCLVLFRSRQIPHEVLPTKKKRFAVSLWISGPAGPGDA